jgi:hypothetical protein
MYQNETNLDGTLRLEKKVLKARAWKAPSGWKLRSQSVESKEPMKKDRLNRVQAKSGLQSAFVNGC